LLGVLRTLAASKPVVLAVDDVQWLDRSSAAMLAFAGRRLREEQVALLLARRQTSGPGSERPELAMPEERRLALRIGPLSMGALHRLLRDRLGASLARPALHKVHEASGGNPLYALELVRALESSGGRIRPGHPLPVPETLEAILRDRIDALPVDVRQVLAAAAALRRPTESILGDWPALEQAAEAGLIELRNDEVSFTHPLLASAAYGSVTAAERRRLHRRLAEVVSDPEERARHLALGAEGPDNEVADALDDAARRAAARGAPEAAELAELAIRLTPISDRGRLLARRVGAAGYHLPVGELDKAASMLEHVVEELSPGGERADALLLLAGAQQSFERCLELAESALGEARGDDARVAKIESYIG